MNNLKLEVKKYCQTRGKGGVTVLEKYYLAIDIGASSGRHILSCYRNGIIETEEIYRFPNGMIDKNGTLCWDVERLYDEILTGMKLCNKLGKLKECTCYRRG
jgi:sugar (pentulose or hexulose) kinase